MQTELLTTCGIAFVAVMGLLMLLSLMIRVLTSLLPDNSPESDTGLMKAMDEAVSQAFPGARVTRVELKE
ncbi:MAG: hypothetical protein RI897_70 [Verrucomicrobiota bacterium]|jgi:hypothetical protein